MYFDDFELDLPPEFCHYQDNGCEFADSCLNCPFTECLYAEPGGQAALAEVFEGWSGVKAVYQPG
ncbi:hypothetical protein ES705_22110 [subsurface metagenome]